MAVVTVSGNPVVGAKYSVTTASSADWASVSNSTYFFDLTNQIVYYKNSSGTVVNPYEGGSSVNIYNTDGTLTADRTVSGNSKILTFDAVRREVHNVVPNLNDTTGFIINIQSGNFDPIATSRLFKIYDSTNLSERFGISVSGHAIFNNTYRLPITDGFIGQVLKTNGLGDVTWGTAGGLTYFTEAQNTSSPNATVNVDSLTAVASTTNADFAIISKGTGALTRHIPDGTSTGGNKRGQYAVDLQNARASASQVASGDWSFVGGGNNNVASGLYSTAFGSQTTASGNYGSFSAGSTSTASGQVSVAMGFGNVASGIYSTAFGNANTSSGQTTFTCNESNVASGSRSFVSGFNGNDFGIINRQVFSSMLGVNGDSQKSTLILNKRTTDATSTVLTVQNNPVQANTQLTLQNNNSIRFKGTIIARQSGSTNTSAWDIDGIIQRGVGAGTTTLLIGNVNVVQNNPSWGTPTLTANTTLGCLTVSVIGATSTNIQWTCIIDTTEVIYA